MTKPLAAALALLALSASALAQDYPTRPITWIVPFAAGGPTDALARNIADRVGRDLGQPVLIENQADREPGRRRRHHRRGQGGKGRSRWLHLPGRAHGLYGRRAVAVQEAVL
ncbi:hypothetical protein OR16_41274 [Cupriavidus basilensis OR16]|uniref:Extra-cytoplasmic solute receptor n=1 Tax=Cupriavidus basilensis OR16 TaxID=1127483 RepID=H1SID4_9BURK|nr:hypothetical protein OR16_41274 [Cupriavidus basilensis OR16]